MKLLSTRIRATAAMVALLTGAPLLAHAQLTLTTGSGSAVSRVDASASFENQAALFDNPYVEDGLSFTRTALSYNNNGCGYAGCLEYFTSFSGNYMYGVGGFGYFSMFAPTGRQFSGLEFIIDNGFGQSTSNYYFWAFLDGAQVGATNAFLDRGTTVGISNIPAFDELRFTEEYIGLPGQNAPAFDNVRAQFAGDVTATPEPASFALLATGLLAIAGIARKRKAAAE
jgi:hypothetical protein